MYEDIQEIKTGCTNPEVGDAQINLWIDQGWTILNVKITDWAEPGGLVWILGKKRTKLPSIG